MVVKHSKTLENIYGSLDNLTQFFSSLEGGNSEHKVLTKTEAVLLNLENELRLTTNYKPPRKSIERN
jgi:hypothetical protein